MFRSKRRTVVSVAAVAAALLTGALVVTFTQGRGQAANPGYVLYQAGHRALAPEFTATSLTGTPIKFTSYRGKVVVVNFWGSWCDPCRREAATLAAVAKQYQAHGVSFLGVDLGDTPTNALAFTREAGITYPSVNDAGYAVEQDFSLADPIPGPPTTMVIDRTGHIAGEIFGGATYTALTTLLHDVTVSE